MNENVSNNEIEENDKVSEDTNIEDINTEQTDPESTEAEATEEKESRSDKKRSKKLEAELKACEEKLAEANDKYTRLFAEYDNFRKRSAKEKEGIYADAYIDALTQILPILDNLERAASFEGADAESLAKGLELTLKSFYETLSKMGVSEIEAEGRTFDPNIHNAVMHIDDENLGENEVCEVFVKGYIRGDKVLRHSMVKVAN